jgi:hypothetical protein
MAWSDPGDFTSGQILTAAQMDSVREAMFFGQATFTNEAARDTAFANPGALAPIALQEGMRAYLTAPTVPAATGTSILPSGISTTYNGSSWVCTTPVAAYVSASQSTTSTSYTDLATAGPAVTLTTGTTALVTISGVLLAGATSAYSLMAFAISGATTRSASDIEGGLFLQSASGSQQIGASRSFIVTGLTAGTNTFTCKYRVTASTGFFEGRQISVQGIA